MANIVSSLICESCKTVRRLLACYNLRTLEASMKRRFLLLVAFLLSATPLGAVHAQQPTPPLEPESGGVVCAPGVYLTPPNDCFVLGPSAYLTDLARLGLTFPPRPLPASKPDPGLTQLPFSYFHLSPDEAVPVYSSPGEKGAGVQQFPPGFVYITYLDRMDVGGVYYLLQSGGWIPGKGARVSEIPSFQGLAFQASPRNSFGWAFEQIPVKIAPGLTTGNTGQQIYPFQTMQIYASQGAGIDEWYMIGPDQWVEGRKVARVTPNTAPPEGVANGRWIDVDLAEQTLAVYDN